MQNKNYYVAMDFGTSNSVIAYGNIDSRTQKIKPVVVELDRKNENGSTSRGSCLPSYLSYHKNSEGRMIADIGDYAKSRYGTRKDYVLKSVKSLLGVSETVPLVDEIEDKTPEAAAGQIISYAVNGAKKRMFLPELKDIMATVPASYDSNQIKATMDAYKTAGVKLEEDHLLSEPKAAICDCIRMIEEGEIPSNLLDLSQNRNILVYDLGGGTLDVTIHKVGYNDDGILNMQDIAISRYTRMGGDNFDELLAIDMLRRFEEMNMIKVPIRRREEVMCKLRKKSEQLKMDLAMAYENAKMAGIDLPADYEFEVMDVSLYDAYAFEETYTKAEIEAVYASLMGYKFRKGDEKRIQTMGEADVNNIIYPILDVLDKAGDVKIDTVLLNGGMTKFYLIRERIRDFFNMEPLATSDPDLAVAKGAVYYHYLLHKYNVPNSGFDVWENQRGGNTSGPSVFCTTAILNDSVNIGLRGEYVSQIVPAGTQLPYRSEEIRDKFRLERATDHFGIELFLGRGTTKNLPNRRVSTRVVNMKRVYPINTPISLRVYINPLRMMILEVWVTDHPETKTILEMNMTSDKNADRALRALGVVEKIHLNAKAELHEIKNLAERNRSRGNHDLNNQITQRLKAIGQASNPHDFFEPCMDMIRNCRQNDMMMGYIYYIAILLMDV